MKIGILGPVFYKVEIEVGEDFDLWGTNQGNATASLTSPSLELAKQLSKDNEVLFFTSLDNPTFMRVFKKHGINTKYMTYENHGLGFLIQYGGAGVRDRVWMYPSLSRTRDNIKGYEAEIFDGLDMMIISDLEPDTMVLCKKHAVPIYYLLENENEEVWIDDSDEELFEGVKFFTIDDYQEILGIK